MVSKRIKHVSSNMFYGDVLLVWTGLKALQKLLKKLYKPRRINPRICGHYCVTLNVNGI